MVPGPSDPYNAQVLPQAKLPEMMTRDLQHRVPNMKFGSNPCRIRYFSQEIVLYRDDVMSRMSRNAVQEGTHREEQDKTKMVRRVIRETPFQPLNLAVMISLQMVQVLMDQAHLAPLPLSVRPIHWDFDHALRLYPMPSVVRLPILSDTLLLPADYPCAAHPRGQIRRVPSRIQRVHRLQPQFL